MGDAYKILSDYFAKWTRLDSNHIEVLTFGYCGAECIQMDNELSKAGMFATKRKYDHALGKTRTTYVFKHDGHIR